MEGHRASDQDYRVITLLSRDDVERLLSPRDCMAAVGDAFRQLAQGKAPPPGILGMHGSDGSFHVKAGFLTRDRPYFAAKLNANFPENGSRHGLPTIQGAVILFDAANGVPLAIMDSVSVTALRTAAATALAAEHLARRDSEEALICGCGGKRARNCGRCSMSANRASFAPTTGTVRGPPPLSRRCSKNSGLTSVNLPRCKTP